ncbi:AHH domain-containing protein [Vibrio parahaemolyticus]|nr:hypothetical protein D0871_10000 [Vibrio parahaemolyticus]EGQ8541500.1 hypothetical protein [Vibrio parahaemolyticus]EGQ9166723.1 hypothetical protein [Vibrio parahaemolyticus]EGQ9444667.1 hypothetical protein [Vibrio parahaemolyticus]EGR1752972.1 hypothetical protein [Vibrio parahaemolyticus]
MSMSNNGFSRHVSGEALLKANHILAEKCDCPLTGHHLISFNLFDKLSTQRIEQMRNKEYSWNSLDNIVILPSSDKSTAKKVACKYRLPWHSSGHTGRNTVSKLNLKSDEQVYSNAEPTSMLNGGNPMKRASMLNKDKNKIKAYPSKAYHKFVKQELLETLEKLHCEMPPTLYRKELNDLSERICDMISEFTILLHNTGDDFSPKGNGCRSSDCQQRTHKNTTWPEIEEIWSGLFYKKSLKFNYLKVASKL